MVHKYLAGVVPPVPFLRAAADLLEVRLEWLLAGEGPRTLGDAQRELAVRLQREHQPEPDPYRDWFNQWSESVTEGLEEGFPELLPAIREGGSDYLAPQTGRYSYLAAAAFTMIRVALFRSNSYPPMKPPGETEHVSIILAAMRDEGLRIGRALRAAFQITSLPPDPELVLQFMLGMCTTLQAVDAVAGANPQRRDEALHWETEYASDQRSEWAFWSPGSEVRRQRRQRVRDEQLGRVDPQDGWHPGLPPLTEQDRAAIRAATEDAPVTGTRTHFGAAHDNDGLSLHLEHAGHAAYADIGWTGEFETGPTCTCEDPSCGLLLMVEEEAIAAAKGRVRLGQKRQRSGRLSPERRRLIMEDADAAAAFLRNAASAE
jgi:hypothetical protein